MTTFAELGLSAPLVAALKDVGYEAPSPIQAATIPPLLAGHDVVGRAQTGTGKTAAFALPVLTRLSHAQKAPEALVLCPTRELALQVCEAFASYGAHLPGVHVLPVYGGQGYGVQLSALRRGVQVVVGTPGRVMDHLEKGTLDLTQLRFLVLDEADEMLKMGFAEDVEVILAQTPPTKQVALFSATMPGPVVALARRFMVQPTHIRAEAPHSSAVHDATEQFVYRAHAMDKVEMLARILQARDRGLTIIFSRTKRTAARVADVRPRDPSPGAVGVDYLRRRTTECGARRSLP